MPTKRSRDGSRRLALSIAAGADVVETEVVLTARGRLTAPSLARMRVDLQALLVRRLLAAHPEFAAELDSFLADHAALERTLRLLERTEVGDGRFLPLLHGLIRDAEARADSPERVEHGIGIALYVFGFILLPVELIYAQRHLNALWRTVAAAAPPSDPFPYTGYAPEPRFAPES